MRVAALVIVTVSILAISCEAQSQQKEPKDQTVERQLVSDMMTRLGAISWEDRFGKDSDRVFFTVQLEDAFAKDPSPTLVCATSLDVVRRDSKYFVTAYSDFFSNPKVRFELRVSENVKARLLKIPVEMFDEFAIVVSVETVRRPAFIVEGYGEGEDIQLELEAPNIFLARGVLHDFVHLRQEACQ